MKGKYCHGDSLRKLKEDQQNWEATTLANGTDGFPQSFTQLQLKFNQLVAACYRAQRTLSVSSAICFRNSSIGRSVFNNFLFKIVL